MTWWLYVLECSDGSLYTGVTNDISRRVRQHNGELTGGARYTRSRRPVKLYFYWTYNNKSEAMKAEHAFKKLSRKQKLERIHAQEANRSPDGGEAVDRD
jgi:Predicted endonuclease containing a URI domain